MTIQEGIKHKGKPYIIPDCSRDDLPEFFKEMGYKVGVEIGVERGEYSELLCKAGLKLFSIDPYLQYKDYVEGGFYQERLDENYERAKRRLSQYDCTLIRKMSMDVVKDFENESIDFVYIDGNHGFKHVTEDLYEWTKKVRKGGIIAGHDYTLIKTQIPYHIDVKWVVDAWTQSQNLDWWLLGSKETIEGEKRDKHRSFMWFK